MLGDTSEYLRDVMKKRDQLEAMRELNAAVLEFAGASRVSGVAGRSELFCKVIVQPPRVHVALLDSFGSLHDAQGRLRERERFPDLLVRSADISF